MTIGVSRDASVDSLYGAGEPLSSRLAWPWAEAASISPTRLTVCAPSSGSPRSRAPKRSRRCSRRWRPAAPSREIRSGGSRWFERSRPYADRAEVRTFLMREMMDAGARRDVTSGLAALVRDTAALALARKGDLDSVKALMTAAALRGPAGDAARAAMVAAPPRRLEQLLFEDEIPLPDDDGDDEDAAGSKADKPSSAKTDAAKKKDAKDKGGDKDKGSDKDKGKGRRRRDPEGANAENLDLSGHPVPR
jgi:hypothetical protein